MLILGTSRNEEMRVETFGAGWRCDPVSERYKAIRRSDKPCIM